LCASLELYNFKAGGTYSRRKSRGWVFEKMVVKVMNLLQVGGSSKGMEKIVILKNLMTRKHHQTLLE
jgi:hypothetical protein